MTARMFVAVLPSIEAAEELDTFLDPFRARFGTLGWTRRRNWHFTLSFMAAVPATARDQLAENLDEAVTGVHPFGLAIGDPGCFPDAARARLVWMGAHDPDSMLPPLARLCRRAAQGAGIGVEAGPFRPHLTVARAREPMDAVPVLEQLGAHRGPDFQIGELVLIESIPATRRGEPNRYRIADRFGLGRR